MTPFKSGKKSTDDHNHPPPSGRTAALRTYLDLLAVPQRPLLPGADLLPLRRQMPQTPEPQPPATEKHAGVTAMTRTIELTDDMHQDEPLSRYTARDRTYAVMAAWMAGEMSEGQAAKLIGHDRVELREHRDELLAVASALWQRFRAEGTTVHDDLTHEVRTEHRHRCHCDD